MSGEAGMMEEAREKAVDGLQEFLCSLLDLCQAESILDIGCGSGSDLLKFGELATKASLIGLDSSQQAIDAASSLSAGDSRFTFTTADASKDLPFEDETFDIVYSKNFLECVSDKDAMIREVHRILRPGGQVAFSHWDWESQLFDGGDKALVRRIVQAFADWQQAWMTDCDGWMGRRLWRVFNRNGLFTGTVHPYVLTSTEFAEGHAGYDDAKNFEALVRRGMIPQEDYERFFSDLRQLAECGQYFYSITMFTYVGRKD
jgi:SAM-dependent methyltransferase